MFCCMLPCVHSSNAIILMGKRELVALLNLSSWCLVMVDRLFLAVQQGCPRFVIVVYPDHTHLLFLKPEAAYDPHCFKMTEVTIIQNFEYVRLLLSRALDKCVIQLSYFSTKT